MAATTSRLLDLLELLQNRPVTSGGQIAERLAVDRRTVRRYITALQELGIPVEGERGPGGGYRMRPGYRLPPLMLTGDEAAIVVLGLMAARRLGLEAADGAGGTVGQALAKISRVLPGPLRSRIEAVQATVSFTIPPRPGAPAAGDAIPALAEAIWQGRRVRASYQSPGRSLTAREFSPHGLVIHSGYCYLAAYDHDRHALRTFRLDRMRHITVTGKPAIAPPPGFDAVNLHQPLAGQDALAVAGRGAPGRPAQPGGTTVASDPRRTDPGRRRHAAADAGHLPGLDGERARRARMRLHHPPARRTPRQRPRPGRAPRRRGRPAVATAAARWQPYRNGQLSLRAE